MIISFKYKFIFIKTYKTAGSSIETYLYNFLNDKDIIAQTKDYKGINCWGDFNSENLINSRTGFINASANKGDTISNWYKIKSSKRLKKNII